MLALNQVVDFKGNIVYLPDKESFTVINNTKYYNLLVSGKELGVKDDLLVRVTAKQLKESLSKFSNRDLFYNYMIHIKGKVLEDGLNKMFINASELKLISKNNNKSRYNVEKYNRICSNAFVVSTPMPCNNSNTHYVFKVSLPYLLIGEVKVIVSSKLLNKSLRQAFVKRVHLDTNIWLKGKYYTNLDSSIVIYASDLILLDDCESAYVHNAISYLEHKEIFDKVECIFQFKAIVTQIVPNYDSYSIEVTIDGFEFEEQESICLIVDNVLFEKALNDADVFNLHIGEIIYAQAQLFFDSDSYDDYSYVLKAEKFVIGEEYVEINTEQSDVIKEQKIESIKYAINSLNTIQKIKMFCSSVKECEITDIVDGIMSFFNRYY